MKAGHLFRILSLLCVVFYNFSCNQSFQDLNVNPNKPTQVPPSLLLTSILNDMADLPGGMEERWDQYFLINYSYYGNNRYDFGPGNDYYATLKNVDKMVQEASVGNTSSENPYHALALFFKAYFFTKMSLEMGDIPMRDALKGTNDLTPVYDSQKLVFQQAFLWLDTANQELRQLIASGASKPDGDFYFNGNLAQWQKVVNAFRLRLLIHLSKKINDPDLHIAQQFNTIVSNPSQYPLLQSNDDNLQYVFIYPTNIYPRNPGNFGFNALRENCSATYVGLLTQLHDPRVFVTSEPAQALVSAGTSPTSFNAFVGADPGEDLGTMYNKTNAGEYSLINRKRYYDTYTGEPCIQIGYAEQCFNIAEAINRGWITGGPLGNAEAYYTQGIQASWSFYQIPLSGQFTAYFLHPGASLGTYDTYQIPVDFTSYYNQPTVKYAGNNATGLTQILQQKYLALFLHAGLEAYYQYRRTGVPVFTTGPGTGNSGRIAMRFQYPAAERTANAANVQAALDRQFGGNDDINGIMWILK